MDQEKHLQHIAERFAVLGEVTRLKILAALREGEQTVSGLVSATGGNQANISRHLYTLRKSGIVDRRKDGIWVYYRIADPTVYELCRVVCSADKNLNGSAHMFAG
jgi:ArsR family transcriptional regulator